MAKQKFQTQAFLSSLPLFREFAPAELQPIVAGTTVVHASRGEIIFNAGDACEGFHLVVYGQVKLAFISPEGAEKVVEIVPPGYSFGEAPMFINSPYLMMAQALADSMLLHIAKSVVFAEIGRDPGFSGKMLAGMSHRVHRLITDVEAYSLQSGTQRVIGYLLRQDLHETCNDEPYVVTLPTSKTVLASRLNVTPEHFSRILHDLAESALIAVDGRDVTIIDARRLKSYQG